MKSPLGLSILCALFLQIGLTIANKNAQSPPDLPATVELDLIIPREGVTYKPIYPFPIVFLVRNARAAWPYTFEFRWKLRGPWENVTSGNAGGFNSHGYGGFDPTQTSPDSKQRVPAPPDTFLVINSTQTVGNSTDTEYFLSYSFGIRNNCTRGEDRGRLASGALYQDVIRFNTSADGEMPDVLSAVGSCPSLIGTIGIVENSTSSGEVCPVVADPAPKGDPCGFTIDEEVASSVASKMLETAQCTTGSWPDATGLVGRCERSVAPALWNRPGMEVVAVVVGTVGFLLMI